MALLTVLRDGPALATATAARMSDAVEQAIERFGSATVSLTGGQTPIALYSLLADAQQPWSRRIDWHRVHLFWGDERHVPPDDPDSNYGMAYRTLVSQVPIPARQVHRMRGEFADASEAAEEYEAELRGTFAAIGRNDVTFDVMLLGMGDNAHIASIFPASPLLTDSTDARVAGIWVPALDAWRITLTPPALLDSRLILMLVAGPNKADAVEQAIEGAVDVARYPAQLLRAAADRVEWFMDAPAAARLRDAPRA
jgi:6-phosphogluconolactonase